MTAPVVLLQAGHGITYGVHYATLDSRDQSHLIGEGAKDFVSYTTTPIQGERATNWSRP